METQTNLGKFGLRNPIGQLSQMDEIIIKFDGIYEVN